MDKFSYVGNADVSAIDEMYQQYRNDPSSVDNSWQKFFEGVEFAKTDYTDKGEVPENFDKEFKVLSLISAYRMRGHLFTETNPVRERRKYSPSLEVETFGLEQSDLDLNFNAGSEIGLGKTKLSNIVNHLKQTYTKSIGAEYMYIRNPEKISWLHSIIETNKNTPNFSFESKREILRKLNQAVVFESFMHKKFVGQKRFSLEGGESLIPALDVVVEEGAELGIEEFVVGMAHRGRLNVLANIFNKTYTDIFSEFDGKEYDDSLFDGDVKYHLGSSSHTKTSKGKAVHLTMSPNPSHLEAVAPVVEGIVRAKIDKYLKDESKICPIIIHGDASIAGQGVVYEVIQMARLDGYKTGGSIHIVVNNQLGFTTNYLDARSSTYCTDVGKVTLSPVFHVNGDDVEAVVHTVKIAMQYRQRFKSDVFIDLLCYRKYGHNEGDEPRFTQPLLYKLIAKHPNPREIYLKSLIEQNVVTKEQAQNLEDDFNNMLQERLNESKEITKAHVTPFLKYTWRDFKHAGKGEIFNSVNTAVDAKTFAKLGSQISVLPEGKNFFKKIRRLMADRQNMIEKTKSLDWAMGELMAYATLLNEGFSVRISGQDVERGTFSHRHAVIKIEDSEEEYIPLEHLNNKQGNFTIYNSFLSEYAVLGFDYGYAMASPKSLVVWEAQFGDFNNAAQIIIDQFLSAAEDKWRIMNGLVMLLPHGYEGQGAEHSSARLERFLQLCAEENMQIVNCTTPANYFHALRRQMHRTYRKPLIVFTPKSLLRHASVVSDIKDFSTGSFNELIDDDTVAAKNVKRVALCSGKVYYDALKERDAAGVKDLALVRLEQMYPFPKQKFDDLKKKYTNVKWIWLQEEPENMGAWGYILRTVKNTEWNVVARIESASPATGSSKRHLKRYQEIMDKLLKA